MIVVKVGGEVIAQASALRAFAADVRAAVDAGRAPLVVHGGGPQASALEARLGLQTRRLRGQRVTDDATLQVVKMALAGEASVDLQAALAAAGVRGLGLCGVSAGLIGAERVADDALGWVGEPTHVDAALLRTLLAAGLVPCLCSLATDGRGQVFNVNADVVAARVAKALDATGLVLLTSTNGVRRDAADPATRIARLTVAEARAAIAAGVVAGGMIPKVEEAITALLDGVAAVHIASGLAPGAWTAELAAPGSVGTVLVP